MSCSDWPDRFSRTVDFLGGEGFRRLRGSSIAVVGLGGVGSHAAVALARSGAGSLLLVDFDRVTESSLNRNPVLGPSDVGRPKVSAMSRRLRDQCPDTDCRILCEFFHHETAKAVLDPAPDLVVDAIDSLNPKVALLEECVRRGIPVVSSMGASGRSDPSLLRVGDVMDSTGCPLARQIRKRLRKRSIRKRIRCVWSVEPDESGPLEPEGDRVLERGRIRNRLPSHIVMPGIFGYACASEAIGTICSGA